MIIKYTPIPHVKNQAITAPLIPVTFLYRDRESSVFALVDSGAISGVISTVIADDLGIDWKRLPLSVGASVGGVFRTHIYKSMRVEIFDHTFTFSLNIVEGISPYKCILGQNDLFKQAKITFEGYRNQFVIEFRNLN